MIHPNTQNMSQLITPHSERLSKIHDNLLKILDSNRDLYCTSMNGGFYADPARRELLSCICYVLQEPEHEPTTMQVKIRLETAHKYISSLGLYEPLTQDLVLLILGIEQAHKTNPTK